MNTMDINGYQAVISYDPDINQFRGEFIELNGGADFYAADVDALRQEGEISLRVFLEMCREKGIEPRRSFSGKFNVRIPPELHARLALEAASSNKSLNAVVVEKLAG
jgi:predicted HicB family RNase H-like nuclease